MARRRPGSACVGSRLNRYGPPANLRTVRPRNIVTGSQVIQPSTRTYYTWSPALIRSAEVSADSGNIRMAANLCDWLLGDEAIQRAMHTRVQALTGLTPSFETPDDSPKAKEVADALEKKDWWPSYPEHEIGQIHTWGLLLGVCPARHKWISPEGHDDRLLPNPSFWQPQHLRYDWTSRKWMIRVVIGETGSDAGQEVELTAGDGAWLLHMPYGEHRPWSLGMWRGLARWALLKAYAISDWGRLGESASRNVVSSDVQATSTKELRQQLADDIAAAARDMTIMLPAGFSYELVQTEASTSQLYRAQVEMADLAFAITIRGGNLTTNVAEGSRAATEVQAKFGDQAKLKFDGQSASTFLHDQSLVWYAEYNYGARTLAPWPKYPIDEKEDLETKAKAMGDAAKAATDWVNLGFKLKRQEFADAFDVSGFLEPTAEEPPPPNQPPNGLQQSTPPPGTGNSPPAQSPDPGGSADPGASNRRGGPAPTAPPIARVGDRVRLASGARLQGNRGFLSGQLYADALVDGAVRVSRELLEETFGLIEEALDGSADYETLRLKLIQAYPGLDHETLMELTERVLVLADLAGRAAVNEDA